MQYEISRMVTTSYNQQRFEADADNFISFNVLFILLYLLFILELLSI